MWVWPLLIVIGLGLLGYLAIRLVHDGSPASDPARRILDDRFARREIDEQEYRQRREGLR